MSEEQRPPVLVYRGPESEVLFLQTLLNSAGIICSVDQPVRGRYMTRDARLFVAASDADAAAR